MMASSDNVVADTLSRVKEVTNTLDFTEELARCRESGGELQEFLNNGSALQLKTQTKA